MGRGSTGAALAPAADSDQRLVAAVRAGDDRAFEVLYERYQRRIHAYVLGMVKDHGRAEDVTQEVFVSALRRMRETEQPLAFKPWLYQIAKNSCIDAFRRSRRAEEVSYDADDALAPGDASKLIGGGPTPDAAVAAKQDLESLCGAFGGLSDTHHEILVLRELEGLSYAEIGRRLGMSRPSVESTLFRARRRLSEEYDDIVSGARCRRVHAIIAAATESPLGARDTRRLARHLAHCQSCRREALAAGLDRELLRRPSIRERIAALLPFGIFARWRGDAFAPSGRWTSQLPLFSDHVASGWGKAAAGAAVLAAGVGAGVGVQQQVSGGGGPDRAARAAAVEVARPSSSPAGPSTPAAVATTGVPASERAAERAATRDRGDRLTRRSRDDRRSGSSGRARRTGAPTAGDAEPTPSGGDRPAPTPATDSNPDPAPKRAKPSREQSSPSRSSDKPKGDSGSGGGSQPAADTPASPAPDPAKQPVQRTTEALNNTVQGTTGTLQNTTQQVGDGLDETVRRVTGDGPVAETVDRVTDVVDAVVGGVKQTVDNTVSGLGDTLNGLTGNLTNPRSRKPGG